MTRRKRNWIRAMILLLILFAGAGIALKLVYDAAVAEELKQHYNKHHPLGNKNN